MSTTEHTPLHVERAEALLARTDEMSWPGEDELDARVDAVMAALPPEEQGVIDLFLRFARPAAAVAAVAAALTVGAALVSATDAQTTSTTQSTAVLDSDQEALDSASEVLALAEESSSP